MRSTNFDFLFSTEISMKNFDENFRDFSISKKIVGRFQNSLVMVLINRFGQKFVQNYVEFHGGGRGIKSKANGVRGRPLQKKAASAKNGTFRYLCHTTISAYSELTT